MKHGGKRKGAGRPPTGNAKERMQVYLSPKVAEYLRSKGSPGQEIDARIERTADFKRWLETQPTSAAES